jgi:hypothetical protein
VFLIRASAIAPSANWLLVGPALLLDHVTRGSQHSSRRIVE